MGMVWYWLYDEKQLKETYNIWSRNDVVIVIHSWPTPFDEFLPKEQKEREFWYREE